MRIQNMIRPEGRVFLKSEWAQISDYWPCVSFTRRSVGDRLRREFVPGRDVLVFVGTTNAVLTEDPDHRSRLISAVVVEPAQVLETKKLVPPESWTKSVESHGDRWPHALPVVRAAQIDGPPFPSARQLIPQAYRSFANVENRGSIVEALGEEREAVLNVAIHEIQLKLTPPVQSYLKLRAALNAPLPLSIQQEIGRMVALIQERVRRGDELRVTRHPLRFAPNTSDLTGLLTRKWKAEDGRCALCGGLMIIGSSNPMMQGSADRIDSENGAYDDGNVQITHLSCNLAKNKYGLPQFEEWVAAVRGIDLKAEAEIPA